MTMILALGLIALGSFAIVETLLEHRRIEKIIQRRLALRS